MLFKRLQVRLRDTLGGVSMLGRWTANQFVAILNVSPSSAMAASRDAAQKLAEPYSFTHNGIPSTLVFQVAAGVVDYQAGSDVLKFQPKLASLSVGAGRRAALVRRRHQAAPTASKAPPGALPIDCM